MPSSSRSVPLLLSVLLGAALAGCGGPREADTDAVTPFPTRTAAGDTAGCTDGAPHQAVCWFIKSLRSEDLTGFTPRERDAAESAGLLPEGDWFVASCELLSKSFYKCRVPFGHKDVGVFEVASVNGSTNTDGKYVAAKKPAARYEVVQYRGCVPAG